MFINQARSFDLKLNENRDLQPPRAVRHKPNPPPAPSRVGGGFRLNTNLGQPTPSALERGRKASQGVKTPDGRSWKANLVLLVLICVLMIGVPLGLLVAFIVKEPQLQLRAAVVPSATAASTLATTTSTVQLSSSSSSRFAGDPVTASPPHSAKPTSFATRSVVSASATTVDVK